MPQELGHDKVKKTIVVESQCWPAISYVSVLLKEQWVIIDTYEHFVKGSYRNRYYIAGPNGKQCLSVPLEKGKNQRTPMKDVRISYDLHWQKQHWHSIKTAYSNAPYYEYFEEEIRPLYERRYIHLVDFNLEVMEVISQLLQADFSFKLSNEYVEAEGEEYNDLRSHIHPNPLKNRAIEGIEPPVYWQVFQEKNGFIANLSILDFLFCEGPNSSLL